MRKRFRSWWLAAVLVTAAVVSGCPTTKKETAPAVDPGPYQERLDRLGVQYEILQKDNPSPTDTYEFRQWLAQADKAIKEGKPQEAEASLAQAEQWIPGARTRFYNRHENDVMSGKSAETAADLMKSAKSFVTIGQEYKNKGDGWASAQYFKAAVEQSDLALISAQRSPREAKSLIELAAQMNAVYEAAGQPERAEQTRERVIGALSRIIEDLDKSIRGCLRQRSAECSTDKLLESEDNYKKQVQKMMEENEIRNQVALAAMGYAPDRFHPFDHAVAIANFKLRWQSHWRPESAPIDETTPTLDTVDLEQEKQLKADLAAHNRLKQGAAPASSEQINLFETAVVDNGDRVFVRGTLTNMKTTAIYNPRITVVGGQLMSNVVDLGYPKMDPLISTSFQLTLDHYSADALRLGGGRLPYHELLLIFQDAEGREVKVIQPVK